MSTSDTNSGTNSGTNSESELNEESYSSNVESEVENGTVNTSSSSNSNEESSSNSNTSNSDSNSGSGSNSNSNSNQSEEEEDEGSPSREASGAMDESGAQIQLDKQEGGEEDEFALGDRIYILSDELGGDITGMIYYADGELLRIRPDGISNMLVDIPLVNGRFDEALQITEYELQQGPRVNFVTLMQLRKGQLLQTFQEDGTKTIPLRIDDVFLESDAIRVTPVQLDEQTGEYGEIDVQREIVFQSQGIPLDESFAILRVAPLYEKEKSLSPEELSKKEEEEEEELEFDLNEINVIAEFILPTYTQLMTIGVERQLIPEISQMSDMVSDLVELLPPESRRNTAILSRIRTFVEMLSLLKNSVISRTPDGSILGPKQISLQTLSDTLKNRNVPLVRPVLRSKRALTSQVPEEEEKDEEDYILKPQLGLIKQMETLLSSYQFETDESVAGMRRWYTFWQTYFSQYNMGDIFQGSDYTFQKDGDFFRGAVPGLGVEGLGEIKTEYKPKKKPTYVNDFIEKEIDHSIRRGLGPTYRTKQGGGGDVELAFPADSADVSAYILFPYALALKGAIGATRTGKFWDDILRSSAPKSWMQKILDDAGGVVETPDAQKIVALKENSKTMANIDFKDYLELLLTTIVIRGQGDISTLLADLGATDMELNTEQFTVVQERVKQVIASVRKAITDMRKEKEAFKPTPNPILAVAYLNSLKDIIQRYPILAKHYELFSQLAPRYEQIDVAIVGYFLATIPDYFLATVGGNPEKINRERVRLSRDKYSHLLKEKYALIRLEKNQGRPPRRNPCPHVKDLQGIRDWKTTEERVQLLVDFLKTYKGDTDGNWFNCRVCKEHLLCRHEILQIQQVLRPREFEVIQKEIVLNFAGGQFGKYHICRNCGQPIAEQDYDKNLEFDDQGRPMMGRRVLEDKDAIEQEEILDMLRIPVQTDEEEIEFDTEEEGIAYRILTDITSRIGITPAKEQLEEIINRAATEIKLIPELYRERKRAWEKDTSEKKAKLAEQSEYTAIFQICYVACYCLLDIQTHIPDYNPLFYMEGCSPGFGGYPLVETVDESKPDSAPGIFYMACVLASIPPEKDTPWLACQWWRERSLEKRKFVIFRYLVSLYKNKLLRNATVQKELEEKREYIQKIFGQSASKGGRAVEQIPDGFLPRMSPIEEITVPEGVHGERGDLLLASMWIRAMNQYAKETARIVPNSPFAEASCCSEKISEYESYMLTLQGKLPQLPAMYRVKQPFKRQTWFSVPFLPRSLVEFNAKPPMELAYQIFLKLCWQGERVGLPHELGHDLTCDWCGLKIPQDALYPDVGVDKKGNQFIIQDVPAIQQSLTDQGVAMTEESFTELTDLSHKRKRFKPYKKPAVQPAIQFLETLRDIEYPPIENWVEVVDQVKENFDSLSNTPVEEEIAAAVFPFRASLRSSKKDKDISQGIVRPENYIFEKLKQPRDSRSTKSSVNYYSILSNLCEQPPSTILESLKTYILVPMTRVLYSYDFSAMTHVRSDFELDDEHTEVLKGLFAQHGGFIAPFLDEEGQPIINTHKCAEYLQQMSDLFLYESELRASRIPHGTLMLKNILRVFVFGPLARLLNPDISFSPPEEEDEEGVTKNLATIRFLQVCLERMNEEYITYNPADVKAQLAKLRDAENNRFINRFDVLSETDKKLEKYKKSIGIGDWAVGGSKVTYQYDKDYWRKTFKEGGSELDMMMNLGGTGAPEGFQMDEFGFPVNQDDYGVDSGAGYGDELAERADSDD